MLIKYKRLGFSILISIFAFMFKSFFAFILLISHMNFSMFIAQVDEVDTYDKNGRQQEDINSMMQYIALVCHLKHKPLPDTDDDNASYSLTITMPLYDFQQHKIKSTKEDLSIEKKNEYSLFKENNWLSPVMDINVPPPKPLFS